MLASALALAPPAVASRQDAGHTSHRPQTHTRPRLGARSQSLNWSGYDVTGGPFTTVTATWVQPRVKNSGGAFTDAAFWVGLDGDGSDTVEQIGTEAYSQGVVGYAAWYEMYPDYPVTIGMAIHPGDVLTATVTWVKPSIFTLTLVNRTTGADYTTSQVVGVPPALASAEVIAEAPVTSYGDVVTLADYTLCRFTECTVDGRPLGEYDPTSIDMVSYSDRVFSAALPLTADGTGFAVTNDFTAPRTTVRGAGTWAREPVTLRFAATDGGTGVAGTEYSLDAGATWAAGTSVTIDAPADHSADGARKVLYRSTDVAGNVEQTRSCRVLIDTRRPTPRTLGPAGVASGGLAHLRFIVADPRPGSPTATVRLIIRDGRGAVVRRATLRRQRVGVALSYDFRCRLARGVYDYVVSATDAAGNRQTSVASNHLVVR